ncbi:MAG: YpdA family putative bacillithiol disulfide reductase [Gemmatimonadota bacterium]|nr:YpdA family putative bacillithiol disulfide reductase [Gemmatimonadota bacterium]
MTDPDAQPLDLAIVGAGPCALAVGVAARAAGLGAVLFDRGCLVQSLVDYPTYMTFFSTPERLEIGGIPFVVADAKPTRREALAYYRAVATRHELDVRQYTEVVGVSPDGAEFRLDIRDRAGAERAVSAGAVVLATGALAHPNRLGCPGDDSAKVLHSFREAHPYWRQDVAVVGGGSSAVEAALALYRAGARVTVIHFEDRFDSGVKPWILPDITNRIEDGAIAVRWRTRVAEVRPGALSLTGEDDGSREELANDWVFAMTGWRPDHRFVESVGVRLDEETGVPEHDPATCETNVPGVFVAGVLTAGYDANRVFIENGRHHGEAIVRALVARGRG